MSSVVPEAEAAPVDLRGILRAGDLVAVAQGASEPLGLSRALVEQAADLPEISVFMGFSLSGLYDVELAKRVRLVSYGAMGGLAAVDAAGLLDVIPCDYSALPALIRDGALAPDVVFVQSAPADESGDYCLGLSMDYTVEAIRGARAVVVEVNDRIPRPATGYVVPREKVTASVAVSRPLITVAAAEPGESDLAIAEQVAALIPDGATVQLGFGSTVNAIGRLLTSRRDLRVHTALVGDWLLDLERAGALADTDGTAVITTGAALGSPELYEFVGSSDRVRLCRIEDVQRPEVLAAQQRLIAVNSAIQVDLAGQVNAEMIGDRRVSALGGHTDFMRGAQAAPHGLSIIALPATAGRSRTSRIVARLDSGWVTTQQSAVDVVITEYGTARLRGATLAQRRSALGAIAAPEWRALLSAPQEPTSKAP